VKSILEASQQRKLNFEEAWIIRCCEDPRSAKTLADVHENIKSLLGGEGDYIEKGRGKKKKREWKYSRKPVSGINAGVYTSLKAYFDIVMPQLARLPYTKKLELGPGLNVMDLRDYAMETQALVIRSVMEWVYQHEKNVRVIVPEAQDFVPQGKNSPVKMACETLVRKAGANRNFMWLDSQDMAAVDKIMLRACSIVGIGVQTEGHEIDRSLGSLFTPALRAVDIARLRIGEFFVRTPEARVSKCYVQPAWMDSELHAQAIAKGEESVSRARQLLRAFKNSHKPPQTEPSSPAPGKGKPHQMLQIQTLEEKGDENGNDHENSANPGSGERPGSVEVTHETYEVDEALLGALVRDSGTQRGAPKSDSQSEDDETMWREKYQTLEVEHKTLIEAHDALAEEVNRLRGIIEQRSTVEHGVALPAGNGSSPATLTESKEEIYRYIVKRASEDPGILELFLKKPELRVKVERQTLSLDESNIQGQIARLIYEGFFKLPKNGPAVQKELKRRGNEQPTTNLYKPLGKLTQMGFLTAEPDGFQEVPEMKVQVQKA
jgi:hypothetical protein